MFRYEPYESTHDVANVVVDGAANAATVLTLSHWPGAPTPPRLLRDLSAEIAFAYLEEPFEHDPAGIVTNNHFDQDGLVSVFVLVDPDTAWANRELLVDLAAAGDFGIYRDRRAARASMVVARWNADGMGYDETLPLLVDLVRDPMPLRALWEEEDDHLSASEALIADGTVTIDEIDALDLAVVRVPEGLPIGSGHRFAHETFEGIHPMAIHNATERVRLLIAHGRRFCHVDRYESWVQFQSRPVKARVDLRPLAAELSGTDGTRWTAGSTEDLAPALRHEGESELGFDEVLARVVAALGS